MDGNYMSSDKHVVIVAPGFAADEEDNRCIPALQDMVLGLMKVIPPENMHMIALHYPFHSNPYTWHGMRVYPCKGKNSRGLNKLLMRTRARRCFRSIQQKTPSGLILHSFWLSESCYLAQKWSVRYGVPHLCTFMGQEANGKNRYLAFLRKQDFCLTVPTLFAEARVKSVMPEKACTLIPLLVNMPEPIKSAGYERDIDLLGVGNLIRLKSYHVFLETVSILAEMGIRSGCLIIGEGPEAEALKRICDERGLSEQVRFAGALSRSEVFAWMQRSKILLHPSLHETFGMVYREALLSGMAIVSRANGSYEPGGRWIAANDAHEMAEAVAILLKRYPWTDTVDFPGPEETVKEYLECYDDLLSAKRYPHPPR